MRTGRPTEDPMRINVKFRLGDDDHRWLKRLAYRKDMSVSAVIRMIIKEARENCDL